jgi:hypothetical protein
MKTTIAGLRLMVAAVFGVVALLAPVMAADNTVDLTVNCVGMCTGSWGWYQDGTLLSSGSISGDNAITRSTTVQPAAADTVIIGLRTAGAKGAARARPTRSRRAATSTSP